MKATWMGTGFLALAGATTPGENTNAAAAVHAAALEIKREIARTLMPCTPLATALPRSVIDTLTARSGVPPQQKCNRERDGMLRERSLPGRVLES